MMILRLQSYAEPQICLSVLPSRRPVPSAAQVGEICGYIMGTKHRDRHLMPRSRLLDGVNTVVTRFRGVRRHEEAFMRYLPHRPQALGVWPPTPEQFLSPDKEHSLGWVRST